MIAEVVIEQMLLGAILENAKARHPRETVLLLRGKAADDCAFVTDIIIPPLATRGEGFSGFPTQMLPMDFSLIGSVHSHPSGNPRPSTRDLNHFFGRIMMIVVHPYLRSENVVVFNSLGEEIVLTVAEQAP